MANQVYGLARETWATGGINWLTAAINGVFVDLADYTLSITTHQFLSDIPAGARVATWGPLTSKTATLGALDAADFTASSVTGDQFEAVVLYINTGSAASSRLLIYIDTADGLPTTPVGGPIEVRWDNGPNRIAIL